MSQNLTSSWVKNFYALNINWKNHKETLPWFYNVKIKNSIPRFYNVKIKNSIFVYK